MSNTGWTWSNLSNEQLGLLAEAERTLGADCLLAYQASDQAASGHRSAPERVQVAALNASQLDCLQGLEQRLQSVVVAYRHSGHSV